jgi:hypothetical protein
MRANRLPLRYPAYGAADIRQPIDRLAMVLQTADPGRGSKIVIGRWEHQHELVPQPAFREIGQSLMQPMERDCNV